MLPDHTIPCPRRLQPHGAPCAYAGFDKSRPKEERGAKNTPRRVHTLEEMILSSAVPPFPHHAD